MREKIFGGASPAGNRSPVPASCFVAFSASGSTFTLGASWRMSRFFMAGFQPTYFTEARHLVFLFGERGDGEAVFRAGQRHIKQAALLLDVKVSLRQFFFHQLQGKFEQGQSV